MRVSGAKHSALRFILLFILISALFSLPKIGTVNANETIYIRAGGNVEGTNKIQRVGDVYTFTSDIYGSIVVERDNIVVNGAGYALKGPGANESVGIDLSSRSNVTISNLQIMYFEEGIRLEGFSNKIIDNHVANNSYGICLEVSSKNNTVSGNSIKNNWWGIRSRGSNNIIYANNVTNNKNYGVYFDYSSGNRVVGNRIENNTCGLYFLLSSNNTVSHNNFVNNQKHVKDAHLDAPWLLEPSVNIWDDGKEGNFWSDYYERYPNTNELNNSGLWDTPYVIDENNQDNYPLTDPAVIPELPDEDELILTADPFPTILIVATLALTVLLFAGLMVYFVKFKKKKDHNTC